ncbi:MAG: NfeD family protein [Planctomycetota bacterium]|jgi:membrane-bound serine protease (ClpP class)
MDFLLASGIYTSYWSAPWVWAIVLLVLALALVVMEMFIPSGGILGLLATSATVAAIWVGFTDGRPWVGFTILVTAVLGLPAAVILGFRWWPKTPLGRRIMLKAPRSKDVLPDHPRQRHLKDLVNRVGYAKSKMLPSGAVLVDGHTVDAVSEGMPVDVGQRVRVIEVHGNRVVVRPVDEETPSQADPDPLSRPIDSIGSDPFDVPPLDKPPSGR